MQLSPGSHCFWNNVVFNKYRYSWTPLSSPHLPTCLPPLSQRVRPGLGSSPAEHRLWGLERQASSWMTCLFLCRSLCCSRHSIHHKRAQGLMKLDFVLQTGRGREGWRGKRRSREYFQAAILNSSIAGKPTWNWKYYYSSAEANINPAQVWDV